MMARYTLTRFADSRELARHVARLWVEFVESRRAEPTCAIALSGGRISSVLYQSFVAQARARKLGSTHLHFFWADERCVPPDHPDSNFKAAEVHLLKPLGITTERIHRIKGELPPQVAAAEASAEIRGLLRNSPLLQLDLIILGMGEDGHVASLFPNARECLLPTDVYCAVRGPKPPPDRVTLSYAVINAARDVWVIVSGRGKTNALRESLAPLGKTPLASVIKNRPSTQVFTEEANFS